MKKIIVLISCIIISITANAQYIDLINFAGTSNGAWPEGSLISDGTFLYGTTAIGGTSNMGTIFKMMPDGSGYSKLFDFAGATTGSHPLATLFYDGTFLYGTAEIGGTYNKGTLFKIMPDGSGYSKLLDFTGPANGTYPDGALISDGTFLYGMTYNGGTNGMGVIFKIMPDGSGYSKLLDFAGAVNGSYANGSLIYDGTFLYGMTQLGGANNMGTIFKIMPDGSGYSKLFDFAGATNGESPLGDLIYDGTFLYGMTYIGGATNGGVIFKIMPDGSGYSELHDFTDTINGRNSTGSLIYDGTFLYGMTYYGGTNNLGTVFKIMPDGSGYSKFLDFAGISNGSKPLGSLISDGTFLYGMTEVGGANNMGVIFKLGGTLTGIERFQNNNNISVYPNPTNNLLNVVLPKSINNPSIEIYNCIGALVYKKHINTTDFNTVDISDQAKGIYFIKVMSDNKIIASQKIIKQ